MNKAYELEQLRQLLISPELKSGLYLLDTELTDVEIESFLRSSGLGRYEKETLIPTSDGSSFEFFVVGLSHKCDDSEIISQRFQLQSSSGQQKSVIIYSLLILLMKKLCAGERLILHIQGQIDLTSLKTEDLYKLDATLSHHDGTVIVLSKQKSLDVNVTETVLKSALLKETKRNVENRLKKVHISYKHDKDYDVALAAITNGLKQNNIAFSIDVKDIKYRQDIVDYEKEIGSSDRVILFVIPSYLKSIDCMFEMSEIFKNENFRERVFPVVDLASVPRNSDGLKEVKDYWFAQKVKKSSQMQTEAGCSDYIIDELTKVNAIIKVLDVFWYYLVHVNTGNYDKLIENNAALLIEELKRVQPAKEVVIEDKFVPSGDTKPTEYRIVNQYGEKSINVQNNSGSIIIN